MNQPIGVDRTANRDGFALVTTVLVVLVLSVLAVGVAWIASSEKKTTFAEGVHIRSVLSADAGAEAAINFIRISDEPPSILDFGTMEVADENERALDNSQTYSYEIAFVAKRPKPGWSMDYKDFDYSVDTQGKASASGRADVDVLVSRLFKEGY